MSKSVEKTKMLTQSYLNEIKEKANDHIEFVLSELGVDCSYIAGGRDIRSSCPVHGGDNDTAFSYSSDHMGWSCYTHGCHEKDCSIFGLVRLVLGRQKGSECSFKEAVSWLEQKLDIRRLQSHYDNSDEDWQKYVKTQKSVYDLEVEEYPTNIDLIPREKLEKAWKPSLFFRKMGFDTETLSEFLITDCHYKNRPMYNRAYTPVLSCNGKYALGATGRIMMDPCKLCNNYHYGDRCPDDDKSVPKHAKWLHYGFKSGSVLYNLHRIEGDTVIVTEGPKDVWWLYQNGFRNAVSVFGNFTKNHAILLLRKGVSNVISLFDNDEAGVKKEESSFAKYRSLFNFQLLTTKLHEGCDVFDMLPEEIEEILKENKIAKSI